MIKVANAVKTWVSPVISQSLNSGTSFTTHVLNHNLGVAPNHVRLAGTATATSPTYGLQYAGADNDPSHIRGFHVQENSPTSTEVNVFRSFPYGDIYFILQNDGTPIPT